MYSTSVDDLVRVASDLDQIAKKYTDGSKQLEQQINTLDGTTSQLVAGGAEQWKGLSSDAFQGAWSQRKARMQQAAALLSESAQYLTTLTQTIEENVPKIRSDQAVLHGPYRLLADDQQSIFDDASQAQNAIIVALSVLNSQLEALAEEVKDCPEEKQEGNFPGGGKDPYGINKNESGDGKTPEERIGEAVGDPVVAQQIIELAKQNGTPLEDIAALLEQGVGKDKLQEWLKAGKNLNGAAALLDSGIDANVLPQLIDKNANLADVATNARTLLDGGVRMDRINGWLKNGTNLQDAVVIYNRGVDLNQLGTSKQVGDFTHLDGASVNDIMARIPADAEIVEWKPDPIGTGTQDGIKFRWIDANGVEWNVRMHGPNLNAPPDSHSASGWIMRVMRGNDFMDTNGNFYAKAKVTPFNPDGSSNQSFDEGIMRDTHIPIQAP